MTIKPDPFHDRTRELAALDRAWSRQAAGGQMMLVYGRRRLGKTFLLQRYFTVGSSGHEPEKPHCYYLAEQSTAAAQRLNVAQATYRGLAFRERFCGRDRGFLERHTSLRLAPGEGVDAWPVAGEEVRFDP